MGKIFELTAKLLTERKHSKIWHRLSMIIACLVVFNTTYSMILPALTFDDVTASEEPGFDLGDAEVEQEAVPVEDVSYNENEVLEEEPIQNGSNYSEDYAGEYTEDYTDDYAVETGSVDSGELFTEEAPVAVPAADTTEVYDDGTVYTEEAGFAPEDNGEFADFSETEEPETILTYEDTEVRMTASFEDPTYEIPAGFTLKVNPVPYGSETFEALNAGANERLTEIGNYVISYSAYYDIWFELNGETVLPAPNVRLEAQYKNRDLGETGVKLFSYNYDGNAITLHDDVTWGVYDDTDPTWPWRSSFTFHTHGGDATGHTIVGLMNTNVVEKEATEGEVDNTEENTSEETADPEQDAATETTIEDTATEETGSEDIQTEEVVIGTEEALAEDEYEVVEEDIIPAEETAEDESADEETAVDETADAETTEDETAEDEAETEETSEEAEAEEEASLYITGKVNYDGLDYAVELDVPAAARIPKDAELVVEEIDPESEEYKTYYDQAMAAIKEAGRDVTEGFGRFFDIRFEKDGVEIEPNPAAQIAVKITFAETVDQQTETENAEVGEVQGVHFTEEGVEEVKVEAQGEAGTVDEITFEASSFSVYGFVYTVDFETVDGGKFSVPGKGSYKLNDLLPSIINKDGVVSDATLELIEGEDIAGALYLTQDEVKDWYINSDVAFTSTYLLTIMADGVKYEIKVTDAQTSNLSDLLTTVTVTGAVPQENGSYLVESGKNYNVHLQFEENDTTTFNRSGSMTYQLPAGIVIPSRKTGTITPGDSHLAEIYTIDYVVDTNGLITYTWNVKPGKQAEFEALTGGKISFDLVVQFDENATTINWNGKGTYEVDHSTDIGVDKTAWFDSNDGKMHYRITATSKGNNSNIELKDTFVSGAAVTLDQDSIQETSTPSHNISISNKSGSGFTATIPSMTNGDKVTIEYTATVDYAKLIEKEGKTGSHGSISTTGNTVEYTGDDDNPNNDTKEAHVDNQISYSSAGKSVSNGAYENGKRTMNWQITANNEHKATITYITDTMKTGSDKMEYSGNGIDVDVYDSNGDFVGSYSKTWGELGVTNTSKNWRHDIPNEYRGTGYSYVVNYKTAVDVGDSTSSIGVSNEAETDYGKGTASGGAEPRPGQKHDFNKTVNKADIPNGTVTWDITIDVPETGLDECVVTDYLPNIDGNAGTFYDTYKSFTVDGLIDGEDVTPTTTTVTKTIGGEDKEFTNSVIFTFTKDGEPGLYPVTGGRQVVLHVVTGLDPNWIAVDASNNPALAGYLVHTNTARHNNVDKTASVNIDTAEPKAIKTVQSKHAGNFHWQGQYGGDNDLDGWSYQVYFYGLSDETIDGDTFTFTDTYDNRYLMFEQDYYEQWPDAQAHGSNFATNDGNIEKFHRVVRYYVQSENRWYESDQKVSASVSGNTITFSIPKADLPKDEGGNYYTQYSVGYVLHVKDKETVEQMKEDAKAAGGVLKMRNTALWAGTEPTSVDVTYEVPVISKSHTDLPGDGNYKFELKINENGDRLGNSEFLTVTDTVTNLTVDYKTIAFTPEDAVVSYNHSGNTMTFIVRNQTPVTITYNASALVSGEFKNVLEMNGESKMDKGNADVEARGESSFDTPLHLHILKHVEGNMMDVLPNVTFQIYKYSETAENHYGPLLGTYTTLADGMFEVTVPHIPGNNNLSDKYVIHEVEPPTGFQRMPHDYVFTISKETANYGQYIYIENDTMPIANTPIEEDELEISVVKTWSGNAVDEKLPDVTIHLWAKDEKLADKSTAVEVNSYTLSAKDLDAESGKWTHKFEHLDASKTYFITEDPIPGYKATYTNANTLGLDRSGEIGVTNTKQSLHVEKVWDGGEAPTTIRGLNINVLKNGEFFKSYTIYPNTSTGKWELDIDDLVYPGEYTVEEQAVSGWTLKSTVYTQGGNTVTAITGSGSATITNQPDTTPQEESLKVEKKWYSDNGTTELTDAEKRELIATVELVRYRKELNGTQVHFINMGSSNDIATVFVKKNADVTINIDSITGSGSAKFIDHNPSRYTYYYEIASDASIKNETYFQNGVSNVTFNSGNHTDIYVVFYGGIDLTVSVPADSQPEGGTAEEELDPDYTNPGVAVLNYANNWTASFMNLPTTGTGIDGKKYSYTYGLREKSTSGGFELVGYTSGGSPVSMSTEEDNEDATVALTKGSTVTVGNKVKTTDVEITKQWEGLDNVTVYTQEGNEPILQNNLSVTVELERYFPDGTKDDTFDGSDYIATMHGFAGATSENPEETTNATSTTSTNEWKAKWKDLPGAGKNSSGEYVEYTYKVKETKVVLGSSVKSDDPFAVASGNNGDVTGLFTSTISADGKTVINTYSPTSIRVDKRWVDEEDTSWPSDVESVTVQLFAQKQGGEKVAVKKNNDTYWTLDITKDSRQADRTFNNLPAKDNAGNDITYSVEEIKITKADGTVIEVEDGEAGDWVVTNGDVSNGIATVTNEKVQSGSLKLSKTVTKTATPSTTALFEFEIDFSASQKAVENGDYDIVWTPTESARPNGVAARATSVTVSGGKTTVYLIDGETLQIDGLPLGATYTITEKNIPDGYKKTAPTGDATGTVAKEADVTTINFTNEYDETSVKVNKMWNDNNDQDGKRSTSVQAQLKANDSATGDPQTLDNDNKWTYTWNKLPKYKNGELITYTVDEVTVPSEYNKSISTNQKSDGTFEYVITNSYTPKEKEVTLTKIWEDNGNAAGHRPSQEQFLAKVHLLADGTDISAYYTDAEHRTVVDNGDNTWTVTWKKLPEKASGNTINYTVTEDADLSTYYTAGTVTGSGYTYSVTNKLKPGSLRITKAVTIDGTEAASVDSSLKGLADGTYYFNVYNSDGTTPAKKADGTDIAEITITVSGGVAVSAPVEVTGLAEGTYLVKENTAKSSNKAVRIKSDDENGKQVAVVAGTTGTSADLATITNDYDLTTVKVTKTWAGGEIPTGTQVEVTLSATGADAITALLANSDIKESTVVLKNGDNTKTWTNLPVYDSAGEKITYSVAETKVTTSDGEWTTTSNPSIADVFTVTGDKLDANNEATINNDQLTGNLEVTKELKYNGALDNATEAKTFYAAIFNSQGTKVSEVKEITIAAGQSSGTAEFTGLKAGIAYTLQETDATGTPVSNGFEYAVTYEGQNFTLKKDDLNKTAKITNDKSEKGQLTVNKTVKYNDEIDTEAGTTAEPKEFSVAIFTKSGEEYTQVGDAKTIKVVAGVTTEAAVFTNLDIDTTYYVFEMNGNERVGTEFGSYHVTGSGANFTPTRTEKNGTKEIVNNEIETGKITVTKELKKNDGSALTATEAMTFTIGLYEQVDSNWAAVKDPDDPDDNSANWTEEITIQQGESSNTAEFSPLTVGKTYRVYELNASGEKIESGQFKEFTVSYDAQPALTIGRGSANTDKTTTVTNTAETVNVKAKKNWPSGQTVPDGTKITLSIAASVSDGTIDGVTVDPASVELDGTIDANETTAWEYEWKDLPKYDKNGKEVIYTVTETGYVIGTKDYSSLIKQADNPATTDYDFSFTNDLPTIDIPVEKSWSGTETTADDYVEITLYKGDETTAYTQTGLTNPVTLRQDTDTEDGVDTDWKDKFSNLPMYDSAGNAITWKLVETKVVLGGSTFDEPAKITTVYSNGGNKPVTSTEQIITQTFTNTVGSKNYKVKKTWGNGQAAPEGAEIQITLAGSAVNNPEVDLDELGVDPLIVTLDGDTDDDEVETTAWEYEWTNLPEFDNAGNAITYSASETSYKIDGKPIDIDEGDMVPSPSSDATYQLIVVNKLPTTDISAKKNWPADQTTLPEGTTVKLTIAATVEGGGAPSGVTIEPTDVTLDGVVDTPGEDSDNPKPVYETTPWQYTWEDLPQFDKDGKKITYTVTETEYKIGETTLDNAVADETASEGFEFSFTNELPKIDIPGTKTWVDDKETHENPKLTLTRKVGNGSSETLKAAEDDLTVYSAEGTENLQPEWSDDGKTYTYKDLPKYDPNGKEYTYEVTEDAIEHYKSEATKHVDDFGSDFVNTELTTFKFSKVWKLSGSDTALDWPEDVDSIIVTFKREAKEGKTPEGTNTVTYTVTAKDIDGTDFEGTTSRPTEADDDGYTYEIINLPKFFVDGENTIEWKYSISETQVDGYNMPIYMAVAEVGKTPREYKSSTDNEAIFVSAVDNVVEIQNNKVSVSLPSTGGRGTLPFKVSGSILLAFSALMYVTSFRRRQQEALARAGGYFEGDAQREAMRGGGSHR